MNKKVYLASPWFNNEQLEREERVKNKLRQLGFEVWSPKENCNCPPDATNELREKTFLDNCLAIQSCDILFAITDGKDMGTIWETGYVCGINAITTLTKKKVVYYCETLKGSQFNLMLAQSGDVIVTDFNQLDNLKDMIISGAKYVGKIE